MLSIVVRPNSKSRNNSKKVDPPSVWHTWGRWCNLWVKLLLERDRKLEELPRRWLRIRMKRISLEFGRVFLQLNLFRMTVGNLPG